MSWLCRLFGHRTSPAYGLAVLVSRRRTVRRVYRYHCLRCEAFSRWVRAAPLHFDWKVCVRCGREGHRSHACPMRVN